MRLVHSNSNRIIYQITDGPYSGMFVKAYDWGNELTSIPDQRRRTKHVEWHDVLKINQALEKYNGNPHDPEMILNLSKVVGEIFG